MLTAADVGRPFMRVSGNTMRPGKGLQHRFPAPAWAFVRFLEPDPWSEPLRDQARYRELLETAGSKKSFLSPPDALDKDK